MGAREREIEDLYRSQYARFHAVLSTITGSAESAHDAVQEAFARALNERQRFRRDGPLEAWVWRIAVRAAHEVAEKRSLVGDSSKGPIAAAFESGERDPELVEALNRLAPRRRLMVFLRYYADLSYADIGAVCDVHTGTVAATLAQARSELLQLLDPQGGRT